MSEISTRNVLAETSLADGRRLAIVEATLATAPELCEIILDAFRNRPPVEPQPAALRETVASVTAELENGFGVIAEVAGVPCGAIIVSLDSQIAGIHRVSVRPGFQRQGIASAMIEVVLDILAMNNADEVQLIAREEFPQVVAWWKRHGFSEYDAVHPHVYLHRQVALLFEIPTAVDMQEFGSRLAAELQPGDLLIVSGELGAGKTTLTQGIGAGMQVANPIISPTFVLSRIHLGPSGRSLLHVDAYRLGSWEELADLDLQTEDVVTVVEWGAGIAERLASDRLEIDISRSPDPANDTRLLKLTPIGERWAPVRRALEALWS